MPDTDNEAMVVAEAEDILVKRIPIKFFQVGGSEEPLEVEIGTTLGDLLEQKDLTLEKAAVMYQGAKTTDMDQALEPGSVVVFARNVKGGR